MNERYKRFSELLALMKTTHDSKGADYEGNGRPYENLRAAEDWGVGSWKYALMRCEEKTRRLKSYAQGATLNNESAFDSLLDNAVLHLIAYVLLEEELLASRDSDAAAPTATPAQAPASTLDFVITAQGAHISAHSDRDCCSTDQLHQGRWAGSTSS